MDVDELARRLDARWDSERVRWDVYRNALQEWAVKVESGRQTKVFSGPALAPVLSDALAWKPLPVVPRNPAKVLGVDPVMEVTKSPFGNGWVVSGQGWFTTAVKTKKEAQASLKKLQELHRERCAAWLRDYGWTLTKTEGVDFRYED